MKNYLRRFSDHFTSERVISISSATILCLSVVYNLPSWIVWVIALFFWFGLSCVGIFFAFMMLASVVQPDSMVKFYVKIAEYGENRGLFDQILDNVPPIVSICAWIALSWHVTALAVLCGWLGMKFVQYQSSYVVSELNDEALVKIMEKIAEDETSS